MGPRFRGVGTCCSWRFMILQVCSCLWVVATNNPDYVECGCSPWAILIISPRSWLRHIPIISYHSVCENLKKLMRLYSVSYPCISAALSYLSSLLAVHHLCHRADYSKNMQETTVVAPQQDSPFTAFRLRGALRQDLLEFKYQQNLWLYRLKPIAIC